VKLLNQTIGKASEMGIGHIHIHCYESNTISTSLIELSGAKLVSTAEMDGKKEKVLRFVHSRI
jgi:predicted acetyltransferase